MKITLKDNTVKSNLMVFFYLSWCYYGAIMVVKLCYYGVIELYAIMVLSSFKVICYYIVYYGVIIVLWCYMLLWCYHIFQSDFQPYFKMPICGAAFSYNVLTIIPNVQC